MKQKTLHINELRLRVNGISTEQARQLGELVSRKLAEPSQTPQKSGRLSSLNVVVPTAVSTSIDRMADLIVEKVIRRLK
jgi:hypothetical protein